MRAQGSSKVLSVVVVLALVSGCSPDEADIVAVVPEPPAPEPELAPQPLADAGPNQVVVHNIIRERVLPSAGGAVQVDRAAVQIENQSGHASLADVPRTPLRLVFECTDGVTFAVRMLRNGLVLYPPGYPPNGSLNLPQVPSVSGVHYRIGDIDLRSNGDLATLELGRERYVDCVANPAAGVWHDPLTLNTEQLEQRLRAVEQPR